MIERLILTTLRTVALTCLLATSTHVLAADKIKIRNFPIDFSTLKPSQEKFGELYWRGGLVLKADHPDFGGFSGIELSSDGSKLLAISDRGHWLTADIVYKDGLLNKLTNGKMAPMLNAKGKRYKSWEIDSEGLTKRNNSLDDVVISSERSQSIFRYKFGNDGLSSKAKKWGSINKSKRIPSNRGLESVTVLPKNHKYRGWLLTIAERKLDKNGNHTAWLIDGNKNLELNIKKHGSFDITDATYLPNGDIVILERSISLFLGPQMQIRQICGRNIKPKALVDGKKLLTMNGVLAVDNMEGLAMHKAANGETILTVVSDNNYHFLQRNLMLQFALVNEKSICK